VGVIDVCRDSSVRLHDHVDHESESGAQCMVTRRDEVGSLLTCVNRLSIWVHDHVSVKIILCVMDRSGFFANTRYTSITRVGESVEPTAAAAHVHGAVNFAGKVDSFAVVATSYVGLKGQRKVLRGSVVLRHRANRKHCASNEQLQGSHHHAGFQ